ncbi:MAG: SDR family NAD(P)-dependent oxidoreductase [Myxococcales bacterium]|nr:SDR family NAD(P)-dependent oxidoreductase [Myxococcales bacterium]
MSLYGMLRGKGPSGFGYASTAEEVTAGRDLAGQTWIVTGSNSGLGEETVRVLCLRGARVLSLARTEEKARAAAPPGADVVPVACELSEPASVRAAVARIRELGHPLSGVVANAGIMALPEVQRAHGVELQLFTNHVGHFLLIVPLLDRLASDGRVVMLSSAAHTSTWPEGIRLDDLGAEREYTPWRAYGQSKLANLLFARELARRMEGGQTANAVHPGVIATNLTRHMNAVVRFAWTYLGPPLVLKSVPEGAATQCWAAVHPDAGSLRGRYLADCNVAKPIPAGEDDALAAALWEKTEEIVARLG